MYVIILPFDWQKFVSVYDSGTGDTGVKILDRETNRNTKSGVYRIINKNAW